MVDDASLARRLSAALRAGDIQPHLQPIVSLSDQRIVGFEVLARWQDPVRGAVSPAEFIPVAAEHGLLDELLDHQMRASFTAAAAWPRDVFLGFNVAPSQLLNPELVTGVQRAAADCRFPLTRVHIEVTETAFMHDIVRAERTLLDFIDLGCMIAMDDFGTGYSSLAWLSALPFSKIKIDTEFVAAMNDQRQSRKIVAAVIALGQSLGHAVVAEGVETQTQAGLLMRMGCQLAQGYLYSRPVPIHEVAGLFATTGHPVEDAPSQPAPMSMELQAFQLAALYDSEQTAIAFTDPGGTILAAGAAFCDLLCDGDRAIRGQRIEDIIPFTSEMLAELRADDLLNRTRPGFECPTPRGGRALIIVRPVRDEESELVGLSVVGTDITNHRLMVDPSQSDQVSLGVDDRFSWELGDHGLVVAVDDSGERSLVREGEPVDPAHHVALGAGWVDFVHPDDLGDALREYADAMDTGRAYDVDLRLHGGDGVYHWFRVHTVPELDVETGTVSWRGHCESLDRSGVYASTGDQLTELLFSFEAAPYTSFIAGADGFVTRISGGAPGVRTGRTHIAAMVDAVNAVDVRDRISAFLRRAQPFDLTYDACLAGEVTGVRCRAVPRRHQDGTVASWHGTVMPVGAAPTPGVSYPGPPLPTRVNGRR